MSNTLLTSITVTSKTHSEWEIINPILTKMTGAYSTDTRELRIGNGIDRWSDLPVDTTHGSVVPHAQIHAFGGRDAILPISIGAADRTHLHEPNECGAAPLDINDKVPVVHIPDLDASKIVSGKLLESVLPSIAITDTFEAASQTAMLALSLAKRGDVCIRTDINKTFILATDGYATLANWKELRTPTDSVLSVAGKTGAVTLVTSDVTESTNKKYVTDAQLVLLGNTSGSNSGDETASSIGLLISGATAKATPVNSDTVGISDSAASGILKKLSWANIKATLKTYFDTLYNMYTHPATHPATMITEDASNRFLTDAERTAWNAANTHANSAHAPVTPYFTSTVTIANAVPQINMYDTDQGMTRYIHFNGGSMGFLTSAGGWAFRVDDVGNAVATADVIAFSDRRLKKDLLQIQDALSKVEQLTGCTFTRIDTNLRHAGLIAQDVNAVLPEAITDVDGYMALSYGSVTGLLVEAIKELSARVEALENQLK